MTSDAATLLERVLTVQGELVLEVQGLRRLVESMAPSGLRRRQQRVVQALAEVFGAATVSSDEIAQALLVPIDTRRELAAALADVCRQEATPRRIGQVLRAIVDAGGATTEWRITDAGTEAGSRLWGIEGTASRFDRCGGVGGQPD